MLRQIQFMEEIQHFAKPFLICLVLLAICHLLWTNAFWYFSFGWHSMYRRLCPFSRWHDGWCIVMFNNESIEGEGTILSQLSEHKELLRLFTPYHHVAPLGLKYFKYRNRKAQWIENLMDESKKWLQLDSYLHIVNDMKSPAIFYRVITILISIIDSIILS